AIDSQRPDFACVVVAVDVGTLESRQPVGLIDVAAGDGAEVAVGMLDDRYRERPRPLLPLGTEWVSPLVDAPAVIAATLDKIDHRPQLLPHLAAPESSPAVEAELPHLSMPERPDLAPGAGSPDERIVSRNRVGAISLGTIHVDAKDGAEQVAEVLTGLE